MKKKINLDLLNIIVIVLGTVCVVLSIVLWKIGKIDFDPLAMLVSVLVIFDNIISLIGRNT